jgi:hypothetical protein
LDHADLFLIVGTEHMRNDQNRLRQLIAMDWETLKRFDMKKKEVMRAHGFRELTLKMHQLIDPLVSKVPDEAICLD